MKMSGLPNPIASGNHARDHKTELLIEPVLPNLCQRRLEATQVL